MADKPHAVRYELHTDLEAAGGTYLATFQHLGTRMKRLNGEGELKVEVEPEEPAAALVDEGRVVRVVFSDDSAQEWRISEVVDSVGETSKATVTALRDTMELAERENLISQITNNVETLSFTQGPKSPTAHLTDHILPALPSLWSLGTIEPTTPIVVAYEFDTPRSGTQKVIEAIIAAGATAELDVRKRAGSAGYYIDLFTQLGSTQPTPDIRTGKNLEWLRRTRTRKRFATRVVPKGDSSALVSDARFLVTNVSGNDVTLQIPEGTGGPVGQDGQLNGMYLEKADGTLTQITASVSATQVVTVASATGVSAKQMLRIRANSAGKNVTLLSRTSTKPARLRGLPITGYGARTNWVLNPVFERWTAGLPDEYTEVDPNSILTIAEDTTRRFWGGKSAKLTGVTAGTPFTCSIKSASMSDIPPTGSTRSVVARAMVYFDYAASTSDISVTLRLLSTGGGSFASTTVASVAATRNTWVEITVSANVAAASGVRAEIEMAVPGLTTWVINLGALQIEEGTALGSGLVVGSHPANLWKAGNDYLLNAPNLSASYTFRVKDLHRRDPVNWPYERIELGATGNLRESSKFDLRLTPRIVELLEDDRDLLAVDAVFSTIPETFSARYAGAL